MKDIMEKTRACICLCNSSWGDRERNMYIFLNLFHPKYSFEKKIKVIKAMHKV